MEARSALSGATDGVGKIQKNFAARPRLIIGIVAAAITGGIAALMTAPGFGWTAAIAWICFGLVLVGLRQASRRLLGAAISGLGLLAVIEILQGSFGTLAAPLFGGALLVAAECGYWSLELRMTVPQSTSTLRRRAIVTVSMVVAGTGASVVLFALSGLAGAVIQ